MMLTLLCVISTLSFQMQTPDTASLQKETAKDPILLRVIRFTGEDWPQKSDNVNLEKL